MSYKSLLEVGTSKPSGPFDGLEGAFGTRDKVKSFRDVVVEEKIKVLVIAKVVLQGNGEGGEGAFK